MRILYPYSAFSPKRPRRTQGELMDAANPLIYQQSPPLATPLGFEPVTLAPIPLVGPQAVPTLLKAIAVKKCAYPNLIVHSPKRPRQTQGELMDAANPPICQQIFSRNLEKYLVIICW